MSQDEETFNLVASNGTLVEISESALKKSTTLYNMVEDLGGDEFESGIPVQTTKKNLYFIVEWCTNHKDDPPVLENETKQYAQREISEREKAFFDSLSSNDLVEFVKTINFLDISDLLITSSAQLAYRIKGKTTQEIRQEFNIRNDFTAEEEAAKRQEFSMLLQ